MLSEQLEAAIDAYFKDHEPQMKADLRELVRIPSVVGDEAEAQRWVEAKMRVLGLRVEHFEADRARLLSHPAYVETDLPYEGRPNVVARLPGAGGGRSLILNGHVDVVSPEPVESWTGKDPWSARVDGDRIYGRGAADMKSGLVANLWAAQALRELGIELAGELILESVIEEEAGGSGGTLACFLAGYTADGLITTEPLGLNLVTGHVGLNYFRVRVEGRTAHAAQSHEGVNAIGKLNHIYDALVSLDEERARTHRDPFFEQWTGRSCNLNIGTYRAGDWTSTVAGWAELTGRISFLPDQSMDSMKAELEQRVREVAAQDPWLRENPPQVEWYGWQAEPWRQDPTDALVQSFQRTAEGVLGRPVTPTASAAGLDNRFAAYFGVPSLCFGPEGSLLHSSDEHVLWPSVVQVARIVTRFAAGWCGVAQA